MENLIMVFVHGCKNHVFTSQIPNINHVHLHIRDYSPTSLIWICENNIKEEIIRIFQNDPSILTKVCSMTALVVKMNLLGRL